MCVKGSSDYALYDGKDVWKLSRDQWLQVSEPVCRRAQDHDCNLPRSQILLIWDLLIRGDDDLQIGRFGRCQQGTVLQAREFGVPGCLAVVS